jgi:hypothetical protein
LFIAVNTRTKQKSTKSKDKIMTEQNTFTVSELQQKANNGDAQAQFALGLYYLPKEVWEYKEGWEFVNEISEYQLVSLEGDIQEIERNEFFDLAKNNNEVNAELAFMWFEKAAEQGIPKSQYATARCYYEQQNYQFAYDWAHKAAEQKFAEACDLLGDFYKEGIYVGQNDEYALASYQDAVNGGLRGAYIKWMKMILRAKGIVDFDEAKDNVETFEKKMIGRFDYNVKQCKEQRFFGQEIRFAGPNEINVPEDEDEDYFFEKALDRIGSDTKWLISELKELSFEVMKYKQELVDKNKCLELEIKEKENANHRMQRLVEQFTHSLGNVIFPDTIYQVAERLKNNPECRKDVLLLHEAYHSEIIIKLQGELLRQRYANTNPEKFRQLIRSCRRTSRDIDNSKSIEDILDYASSRVTARFLNQHYAGLNSIRDKILSKKDVSLNALKQKFEDDILLNKSLRPIAWINENLRSVKITEISPLWKKVFILSESHAEALLFGYFSEILFNAFKYADHDNDEFLTLVFDEKTINDTTYLSCSWKNPVKDKAPSMSGSGKGLDAIQEDLKQLNDTETTEESLLISQQKNQFQVTLFFKKDLLVNELPILKIKRKANTE